MSKFRWAFISSAFVLLAGAGCGYWWFRLRETPENAWRALRDAACEGSAVKFWDRADWSSISGSIRRKAESGNHGTIRGKLTDVLVGGILDRVRSKWSDDLARGEAGDWCASEILDVDGLVVHWATPDGKHIAGRFGLDSGKYRLMSFED